MSYVSWLTKRSRDAADGCCGTQQERETIELVAREFAERVGTYMTDYVEGQNSAIYYKAVAHADKETE